MSETFGWLSAGPRPGELWRLTGAGPTYRITEICYDLGNSWASLEDPLGNHLFVDVFSLVRDWTPVTLLS